MVGLLRLGTLVALSWFALGIVSPAYGRPFFHHGFDSHHKMGMSKSTSTSAPEIDAGTLGGAVALLAGGSLLLKGRRSRFSGRK